MGVIARDKNQLTIIYSSETRVGRQTLGYLAGTNKPYLAIDLVQTKITGTQWVELANAMNVKVGDLVDKRQLGLTDKETSRFGSEDWIKIIRSNNNAISQPIVIRGEITKQITNPSEVMEFFDVDSAGLDQSPSTKDGSIDIQKTTDGESYIEPK